MEKDGCSKVNKKATAEKVKTGDNRQQRRKEKGKEQCK
jgi:hypothetical protein